MKLYHSIEIKGALDKEQVKDKLKKQLPEGWEVSDAILPGRDICVAAGILSGVFISVKPLEKSTLLKFNIASPNFLLRGLVMLISFFTSSPVVDYVYQVFLEARVAEGDEAIAPRSTVIAYLLLAVGAFTCFTALIWVLSLFTVSASWHEKLNAVLFAAHAVMMFIMALALYKARDTALKLALYDVILLAIYEISVLSGGANFSQQLVDGVLNMIWVAAVYFYIRHLVQRKALRPAL